ncbi:MAG: glycosyltransferase family 2 protein [Chloroflexi bacterium]|nr:glycosyltransferase family 2 protein [Chloroflexota bacterium]
MLSVIIPVYNGGENFRQCLASLALAVPPPAEVIVVVDGATDASGRIAQAYGAQVITLNEARGGPARARNIGARQAHGDAGGPPLFHALTLHTFWRQHFTYGRGAFQYHQKVTRRGEGGPQASRLNPSHSI